MLVNEMPEIGYGVIIQQKHFIEKWRRENGFDQNDKSKFPVFGIPEGQIIESGRCAQIYAPLNVFPNRAAAEENAAKLASENEWRDGIRFFVRRCKGFKVSPTIRKGIREFWEV
ncbi:hypothetical protein J4061_004475 [Salmonella enterica]|nr:hypothetical protein [Salmonella enterica]